MLSLQQLTKVVTEEQALDDCLQILTELKFNARAWQVGSVQLTIVRMVARLWSRKSDVIASIASGGYNDLAVGDWLELLSISHYQHEKKRPVATQGIGVLTASVNAPGPFTIAADDLVAADTVNGYTYRNKTGGVLVAGGTLPLTFEAEVFGAQGDIASNTLTALKTPLAGVTLSNPTPEGSNSWITRNGADAESDPSLRVRNASKWGTIGSAGVPSLAYINFALQADASVRRVWPDDQNPRGPGTLDLYVAGDAGEVSSTVVQAVQDYIDGVTDGKGRKAMGSNVLVLSAVRNSVPLRATVYITSQYNNAATQQAILDAVRAYFKVLPIGGTRVDMNDGVIVFGELLRAIISVPGVRNAIFTFPLGDLPVLKNEVIVPVPTFSYVGV